MTNEFRRLASGVDTIIPTGSNTIVFIPKAAFPKDRTVTYRKLVCEIRTQKSEMYRMRLAVGGNKKYYPDDVSTPTSELITANNP